MQKEQIESTLKYISLKYAYYNIFVLLFSLYQFLVIPFALPITILIISEFIFWKFYSQGNIVPSLQHVAHILAGIFVLVVYYMNQNYYVFVNVFILISSTLGMKSNYEEIIQHEYTSILKYVKGFCSFSILIASICITIKLDNFVNWTWSQTFWWYWMYLSALIGSAFTILMILVSKIINQFYYSRSILHPSEYKTLGLSLYVLTMSSLISGAWIVNTFDILGIDMNFHIGRIILIILIASNIFIFGCLAVVLLKDVIFFFSCLINQELRELPTSPRQEEALKKQIMKNIVFLKQISSAYYRKATTQEIENCSNHHEIFTERVNQSQCIVTMADNNKDIKRIKNHKQKTDLELERRKSQTIIQICIICCERFANAVLMRCGHGGICYDCAFENIQKNKECFLCRQQVQEIYEIEKEEKGEIVKVISKTTIN